MGPTLFSMDVGRSLFAEDGLLWKRGRNVQYMVKKCVSGKKQKLCSSQEHQGIGDCMEITWTELRAFGSVF